MDSVLLTFAVAPLLERNLFGESACTRAFTNVCYPIQISPGAHEVGIAFPASQKNLGLERVRDSPGPQSQTAAEPEL